MNKILIIIILFFTQQIYSQTQREMNENAKTDFVQSDNKLNSNYKLILTEYELDTTFIKNLKIAQRIWIKFRDAEVEMKYPTSNKSEYGSVFPMCRWIYLTNLTEIRIQKLNEWIIGIEEEEEEEDVCKGSTKQKE